MTSRELQIAFGIELNQFHSRLILDSVDIFYWLSKAQEALVKNSFTGIDADPRMTTISSDFIKQSTLPVTTTKVFAFRNFDAPTFILPDDYLYYVSATGTLSTIKYPVGSVIIKPVQKDDIYRLLSDPFNKSDKEELIGVIRDKIFEVFIPNLYLLTNVELNYLRKPAPISLSSQPEINDGFHRDIVELAVSLFLNNTRNLKEKVQRETPTDQAETQTS